MSLEDAVRELLGALYIRKGPIHDALEAVMRRRMAQAVADPALREALIPDYPLGCKRPCISDDYLPALQRDDVTLVTDPIEAVEGRAVRCRSA